MSLPEPNAAWHPALMPNAAEDIPTEPTEAATQSPNLPTASDEAAKTHVSAAIPPNVADAEVVPPPPTHEPAASEPASFEPASHDDPTADAWFPQYDAGKPASPSAVAQPKEESAASLAIADDVPPSEAEPNVEASRTEDRATKHQSTVSFARTVTNEISWDAEDDDPEWNLPRTDTDPFKFMPKSNRTNSFPVVPPLESQPHSEPASHDEPRLGSSEAMDIIHEVDHEVEQSEAGSADAHLGMSQSPSRAEDPLDDNGYDAPPNAYSSSQPVEPAEDASEARYEEGLPLISHDSDDASKKNEPKPEDPFGDAVADEQDDFFGSAAAETAAEKTEPSFPPKFERKSTMQVLRGMSVGADSDLPPTPEEEAEESLESYGGAPMFSPPTAGVEEERVQDSGVPETTEASSSDLAAQWAAALADDEDDELLLDDSVLEPDVSQEVDPAAFFGDDDEGFLEDEPEQPVAVAQPAAQPAPASPAQPSVTQRARSTSNRYLPESAQMAQAQQPAQAPNPYLPSATFAAVPPATSTAYNPRSTATSQFPVSYGYDAPPASQQQQQQQQQRPPAVKAQSFADKPKGGYHSPYDLPMDFVTPMPRKRPSMQQLPRTPQVTGPPLGRPPARSTSLQTPPTRKDSLPPTPAPVATPPVAQAAAPPPPATAPARAAAVATPPSHESFFEDLPIVAKARPASRHGHAGGPGLYGSPNAPPVPPPQPTMQQQYAPPSVRQAQPPPPQQQAVPQMPPSTPYMPSATLSSQQPTATQPPAPEIGRLVSPPRVNPYAPQQSSQLAAPPPAPAGRYSPSPNHMVPPNNGMGAAPPANRYSPAPPGPPSRTPSAGYAPAPTSAPPPPILPHQPRTSSPLAHFEISYDKQRAASTGHAVIHNENSLSERRSSSSMYEPRLNRVPSLPPTQEVLEEDAPQQRPTSSGTSAPPSSSLASQYSPQHIQQTPPPSTSAFSQTMLSPPKRILNYTPQSEAPLPPAPPKRSQTQSPGALYGNRTVAHPVDPIPRPSSVQEGHAHYAATAASSRPRGASQNFNLVPPADGTENDPLERWKGAPVFAWGVGGAFVSSFPQDVPRYVINQTMPLIHRAAGEVTVNNMKEIQPLEERLAKFPGPLRGKSKKRDTLAWITAGIEDLERSLPVRSFATQVTHEDKRLEERVLLWKILRLFVENDGILEGTPAVEKAVRDVLSPYTAEELATTSPSFTSGAGLAGLPDVAAPTQAHSDALDSVVLEQIRKKLLMGEKEKAAWDAVDKRLWGHALLISGAASSDLFKKVAQEFVRKEVNTPGHHNEPLAALYEVLSGNHEECVDELVPVHARAGLQLMTTQPSSGQVTDVLGGLDKWRETLCLVLSNRSPDDVQAINSLGNLLSGYGRAEAAHVCYLFSRNVTIFGGLDDPLANFVLLGADHRRQVDSFAKETDAVLLSEVYEYGLSLAGGGTNAGSSSPHLAAYKLQHALTLAEYGFRDKALQYCESILNAMSAQTRRSPYYHSLLETAVEDLMKRLQQAPKEESNSWIPKPSMNKVSDTVWNRFNKFVAGDENEGGGPGAEGGVESGPFARLAAGGSPTISRPPSAGGATGMEMFGSSTNLQAQGFAAANGSATPAGPPPPITRAASRYAPGVGQPAAPSSSYEPSSTYAPPASVSGAIPIPHASARNAYDPASSSYTPPSTLAALEQSAMDPSFRRPSSDVSPGLHPSHMPNAVLSSSPGYSDSSRGGLSRKSSYVPLSQAPPSHPGSYAPPTVGTPPANPYESSNEPQLNGSPYAPVSTSSPIMQDPVVEPPTPQDDKHEAAPSFGYQPPSYGYEPPSMDTSFDAASEGPETSTKPADANASSGYAPPSFEPYSYEPPSFEAAAQEDASPKEPKPKKKSFMDDDEDDIPALKKPAEKTKAERDRENAEMVRRVAEEEAKRAEAEKAAKGKKGWGIGSWFGGSKKEPVDQQPGKPIRANLGEKSSFYFDPELKRWVNKAAGPEDQTAKAAPPPPPPRSNPQSAAPTPPPPSSAAGPPSSAAGPPMGMGTIGRSGLQGGTLPPRPSLGKLVSSPSAPNLASIAAASGPPGLARTSSQASLASGPPSRPATSMGDATSIDDLLGAPGAGGSRKTGTKRGRKGRYVDVMAK